MCPMMSVGCCSDQDCDDNGSGARMQLEARLSVPQAQSISVQHYLGGEMK